jgi:hypothetical protein
MITINDRRMVSDQTEHWAVPVVKGQEYGNWSVSWLPGQPVTRNQAITAMVLAEQVTSGVRSSDHPRWPFIVTWAAELDLDPQQAVSLLATERGEFDAN